MSRVTEDLVASILTPDQRLRIFVSSTLKELATERDAVARAIRSLRLTPVMFELGARPHPPQDLYRSYLEQSHVFIGIYHESYGWVGPGMDVSGLEDEYLLSEGTPRLIYVKEPAPNRDSRLDEMLDRLRERGGPTYRSFRTAEELEELVKDDLVVLLSERFAEPEAAGTEVPPAVPSPLTPFIGRQAELDRLLPMLRDPRSQLITILGPGGVGKTRLALEAARRTVADFPDGAIVVWLDSINDPALMTQAIAGTLGVRERAGRSLMTALQDRLTGKRMLIVLDNFEHVMPAAFQVNELLSFPNGPKFLVTSRELLRVRGESVLQLDPFPLPEDDLKDPLRISELDAVKFFVDRARAASPEFSLSDEYTLPVIEIVRRLDGLPLALELAAARTRILAPPALLEHLASALDMQVGVIRDLPDRQRTIRDTVAWSYDLLTENERIALEGFSVFVGGASLDAAQMVIGGLNSSQPFDLLASLVDKSLIRSVRDGDENRFRIAVAIREYAAEKVEERGIGDKARDLHASYFAALASDLGPKLHSPDQVRSMVSLEREHDNLQATLEWLLAQDRVDTGLELCKRLRWFWWMRGHLSLADSWLERFLGLPGGDQRLRATAVVSAGIMALELGELERADETLREAISMSTAADYPRETAWARTTLGVVHQALGKMDSARSLQEQALAFFVDDDNLLGQCSANTRLGGLALALGDNTEAESRFNESLSVRRKIKDPWGTGFVLTELGALRFHEEDLEHAQRYLDEAHELLTRVGNTDGIARVNDLLGQISAAHGDWPTALVHFRSAQTLHREIGNRYGMAIALAHLSRAEVELGEADRARKHARDALEVAREVGHPHGLSKALEAMDTALANGGPTEALKRERR